VSCSLWSAVTCHRFGRLRPVAAFVDQVTALQRGTRLRKDAERWPEKLLEKHAMAPSASVVVWQAGYPVNFA
jgi:hypothetical protein